jgi:NADPH:quinone reductase-like Zn-dependent oxidoreductase
MQGYVLTRYKRPLELREVPVPKAGEGEVLIRVRGAGLNPKPVIDRVLPFRQIPDALAHVKQRRAKGKVIVRL